MIIKTTKKETIFINAYIETIDFTECGDSE